MGNKANTLPKPAPEEFFEPSESSSITPILKSVTEDYSLHEKLGSGAFSVVYRGTIHGSPDQGGFAIKLVTRSDKKKETKEDVKALLDEVSILKEIHHPHVMRLFAFYEDPSHFALVTELVSGGELFDRIVKKQQYNELIARDLVKIFLETLDFLHSHGIVHRDLKPENLLLSSPDNDTDVKIADFGFAIHDTEKLNTVCGTPDYIAPEVCALLEFKGTKDQRPCYNSKVDIWSAGVIVFILIAGYPPFFDENRKRLFRKIRSGKFEFHPQCKRTKQCLHDLQLYFRKIIKVHSLNLVLNVECAHRLGLDFSRGQRLDYQNDYGQPR